MAVEITDKMYNALVAELKKNPGNSERHYAEKSGIPQGQIGSVLYKAEVEADPKLKIPATSASVVKARNSGLRWPRIAARTGKSVAEVKALFEETGGSAAESYAGRGRNFASSGGAAPRQSSGTKRGAAAAPRGTSGRRAQAQQQPAKRGAAAGTSGRRGAASPK